MKSWINLNVIGAGLVVVGFLVSLAHVITLAGDSGEFDTDGSGKKVIRIVHWQLEPGYREGLEEVIQAFNALPENIEAGVEVRQLAITERVYPQFLNVHILSGTAPDICERGMARMTAGDYTAKYFEPLGQVAQQPNPFNRPENLPEKYAKMLEGLNPELLEVLQERPLRETFVDGMRGGWNDRLQEYYAIPTSFFGPVRLYYNKTYMQESKAIIAEALAAPIAPAWLEAFKARNIIHNLNDPDLLSWAVDSQTPPDTFGRLLLVCDALRVYADRAGKDKLVPISGSKYSMWIFDYYLPVFTAAQAVALDEDIGGSVSNTELLLGLKTGKWDLDGPYMQGYYELVRSIAEQFPTGWVGLDREQANRRFVLGNGGMIATGGWDAGSLFQGASESGEPFDVGIMKFPLPGPGEKWSEMTGPAATEAGTDAGAPYQIYQQSRHKPEAIRFLQFFASFAVNEDFNRVASWIPVIVGATPTERMKPFTPDPTGVTGSVQLRMKGVTGLVGSEYNSTFELFLAGDASAQDISDRTRAALANDSAGMNYRIFVDWRTARDQHSKAESMLAVQQIREYLMDVPEARERHRTLLLQSVSADNAVTTRQLWHKATDGEPFPEFDR